MLRYKSSNLPIKKSNSSLATSNLEKVELFKTHLFQIFQSHFDIIDDKNMNSIEIFIDFPLHLSLPIKSFPPSDVKYGIQRF